MPYRLDISSLYFYEPMLFLGFHLLQTYKNLGLPFGTFTFTFNSYANNHFYKYIYLFQILYSVKSVYLLKYMFVFYIQISF